MKYIMCWTMKRSEYDFEDAYIVFDTKAEAKEHYDSVLEMEDLYCAAITIVLESTDWSGVQ